MKKTITLTLLTCVLAFAARADVIFQDTFNYANGVSTNVSSGLWIKHSGTANPSDSIVNNHRLEVSTTTAYLGVTVTRQDDVNRQFSITNGAPYTNAQQVIYASCIVNFTNLPMTNGQYFAHFVYGTPSSSSLIAKLWALQGNAGQTTNNFAGLPNTFRLGVSATGSASPSKIYPVDLALNTDYQVVLGWNPTTSASSDGYLPYSGTLTLWVNPISPADVSVVSSDSFTGTSANIVRGFAFRQATGFGGFLTASNLVVSTTYLEAATNGVVSTNAVAPKVVYQPVGVTNFVGGNFNLSAVANGQGLAGLTYQWQYTNAASTVPANYSNPNGNTNVLAFTSATAQTNYYTLVVTTPYGLSVTSAVANVIVSAAPAPPAFVQQPGSQSLYTGQNMVLTTTISGPGNSTYTWYSNSVVVATTGPDNSGTSTFEIDNVIPANSATYKVAVTNDVWPTGIVSTNAVVTVTDPPTVTIEYLRQLQTAANSWTVTNNSTTPFKVSGVITTCTNLTTGNTSSYYLQDATAGINIFATFGSTFRPAQGDTVTFIGVVSSFSSGFELYCNPTTLPYTSYTDTGTGTLPSPLSIAFNITNTGAANLSTNILGRYCQLSGVYFTNNGAALTNGITTVTNAAGQRFQLEFPGNALDIIGQVPPAYASTVTGVMWGNYTNAALAVTRWTDVVAGSPPVNPIPLSAVFAGGNITFTWSDASFSLQTATNLLGPWNTITGAASGFNTNVTSNPAIFYRLYHP